MAMSVASRRTSGSSSASSAGSSGSDAWGQDAQGAGRTHAQRRILAAQEAGERHRIAYVDQSGEQRFAHAGIGLAVQRTGQAQGVARLGQRARCGASRRLA